MAMNDALKEEYDRTFKDLKARYERSPTVETSWMGWLFHITSVENAVSILENGTLWSRHQAVERGLLRRDQAASTIIKRTDSEFQNCARFYLRPRTQTFFHNEGFRTQQELDSCRFGGAHCPVPVAFVFDAPTVLAMPGARFSDTNLSATSVRVFERIEEFRRLPFNRIYHHHSKYDSAIRFHQQAEVFVPEGVPLEPALRYIFCRSDAETATFRTLLANTPYADRILTVTKGDLFEAKRLFVKKVEVRSGEVVIDINPPEVPSSFEARLSADIGLIGRSEVIQRWILRSEAGPRIRAPFPVTGAEQVLLTLQLNRLLAYKAVHTLLQNDIAIF